MALYRLEAKVVQRSKGHSAIAGAAYRSGTLLQDHGSGKAHDYQRKRGIVGSQIIAPENAPGWVYNREELWNRAERAEKRWDAQPAREILLALPHELTDEERADLVHSFAQDMFVSRGMVADIAIHRPDRNGDERNDHAHILLTMRELDGDGFASKKQRDWNKTELLEYWREEWAVYQNRALEEAGLDERVDHRTLEAQGIPHEPTLHMGKDATALERAGITTRIGDDNREIRAHNEKIDQLLAEYAELDAQIAAELEAEFSEPDAKGAVGKEKPREIEAEEGIFHIGAISNPLNLPASALDEISRIRSVFNEAVGGKEVAPETPLPVPVEAGPEPIQEEAEEQASIDLFSSPIVKEFEADIRERGEIPEQGIRKSWIARTVTMFENFYYDIIDYVGTTINRLVGGNEDIDQTNVEPDIDDFEPDR